MTDLIEIRRLIIIRRNKGGLSSNYESIARWLFREHNFVTSVSWIENVVKASKELVT